jgi:probable rRNA maturation factor
MILELIDNQDEEKLDLKRLQVFCDYISEKFDPDNKRSINIIFIDDKKMREMNREYRNIDSTTDVLSFSYLEESISQQQAGSQNIIGEVYISPATARKNSSQQEGQWSFELETVLLIIHGILHIFGYDHENDEEKAEMYNIQDSLVYDIRNKDWNRY